MALTREFKFLGLNEEKNQYIFGFQDNSLKRKVKLWRKNFTNFNGKLLKNANYSITFESITSDVIYGVSNITLINKKCNMFQKDKNGWKIVGNYRKEYKDLYIHEILSNENLEIVNQFRQFLWNIGMKTTNLYTQSNILKIYEDYIKDCDFFEIDENSPIKRGKYQGKRISEVPKKEIGNYLRWVLKNTLNPITLKNVKKALEKF